MSKPQNIILTTTRRMNRKSRREAQRIGEQLAQVGAQWTTKELYVIVNKEVRR